MLLTQQDVAAVGQAVAAQISDATIIRVLVGEEKSLKIRHLCRLADGRDAILIELCGAPTAGIKTMLLPIAPELVASVNGLFFALADG